VSCLRMAFRPAMRNNRTMSQLLPCPGCRRHVRASEARCPFCGEIIMRMQGARAVPEPQKRLTRAGVFLFASTLAVTGCGGKSDEPGTTPGVDSATDGTTDGVTTDTGGPGPMYGAPTDTSFLDSPSVDSTSDASDASDGGTDGDAKDTGGGAALYGAAPFH
jgi:hypothetical protein